MKSPRPSRLDSIQPGTQFAGKYEVIEALGHAPGNPVYKVRDLASGQALVLRFYPGDGVRTGMVQELRRKLLVERSFSHENVERIYAVGEHAGQPFVICESFNGRELFDLLSEQGRLPLPEFLRLFRQICTGLAYIHSTGAVHGNLTSHNVLVSASGAAKLAGVGLGDEGVDAAADTRAAGSLFLEMLGARSPRELPPDLAGEVAAIIRKCVDPRAGFRDGRELLEAASRLAAPPRDSRSRRTLADFAAEDPADVNDVVPVFIGLVEQLMKLQSGGTPHLGFSPRDVRVAPDGSIDVQAAPNRGVQHTVATEPKYCPPELFREAPAEGGEARSADIYVLGFIMYEILLGQRLFRRQFEDLGPDPDAFQWMRWHADPQRTLAPLPELIPNFPKALGELIRRMTEKDPARRVATLAEVREGLGGIQTRVVDTQVPSAAPVEEVPSGARPKRRRTGWLVAAAFVLAAAAAGWFFWPSTRSPVAAYPPAINTSSGRMALVSRGDSPWFYIDEFETTNWQYRKFCDETQRAHPPAPAWDPEYFTHPEYPVRNISAEDYQAYSRWAGKRLPAPDEVRAAAPRFDRRRHPWQSDAPANTGSLAPPGTPPAEKPLYAVLGFRSAADPRLALELAEPAPWWRRFWPLKYQFQ